MKLSKFYASQLNLRERKGLDAAYQSKMRALMRDVHEGDWSEEQKKVQKVSILSNIALYQVFLERGIEKKRALELVRMKAYRKAHRAHKVLSTFFMIPGFPELFRKMMSKQIKKRDLWQSEVLADSRHAYSVDIKKCLWADTCAHFDCPELCEVFCLSDPIIFGNLQRMYFQRTQTLGMSGNKCDFRFQFKR